MKTPYTHRLRIIILVVLLALILVGCGSQTSNSSNGQTIVNLGYFPNLTHAVALVGVERGTFQNALGSKVKLETKTFNAGPALIEALFAVDIDIGYVGPNPAINGYVKSHGEALRVIAGAASGGALFIVRPGANIQTPKDLANKKFATPQLGGTQDVALRYYLQQNGLKTADKGGNVQIIPTDNPNILTLFKQGKIDGAWVPEPWATRLVLEGGGKVLVDERDLWPDGLFATTLLVVRTDFLRQHTGVVRRLIEGQIRSNAFINSQPADAQRTANAAINEITGKPLSDQVVARAWTHMTFTNDPVAGSLRDAAQHASQVGLLSSADLRGIFDLGLLNQSLSAQGEPRVMGL